MQEIENLDEERKSKKKARDKKIFRYVLLPIIAVLAVFTVMEIVNPTPNWEPAVSEVDPQIAVWQEYEAKVMPTIDSMGAAKDCDGLFNEIRVADGMQFDKGPRGWINEGLYNWSYSTAVSAGCDMTEIYK
jgi:hypothetical protein